MVFINCLSVASAIFKPLLPLDSFAYFQVFLLHYYLFVCEKKFMLSFTAVYISEKKNTLSKFREDISFKITLEYTSDASTSFYILIIRSWRGCKFIIIG